MALGSGDRAQQRRSLGQAETRQRGARRRVASWVSVLGALSALGCFDLGDAVGLVSTTYVCGNGKSEPYEDCDDGNTRKGDGCNDDCQLESGWVCSDRLHCERKGLRPRPDAPGVAADGGTTPTRDGGGDAALPDAAL
jgi:cysteine-rich repeat protein